MSTIKPISINLRSGEQITVRTANKPDAPQIVKLMKEVIKEGLYTLAEPDEYKATVKTESAKITRFKQSPGKIYIIAELKNIITGFISFDNWDTRRTQHTGLFSVYLNKKYRGKGIGKILVEQMLDWGKTNPVNRKISLYVFSTNKSAISLYKHLGFKQEGRCPNDMIINGKYVDSIMMYKFTK